MDSKAFGKLADEPYRIANDVSFFACHVYNSTFQSAKLTFFSDTAKLSPNFYFAGVRKYQYLCRLNTNYHKLKRNMKKQIILLAMMLLPMVAGVQETVNIDGQVDVADIANIIDIMAGK